MSVKLTVINNNPVTSKHINNNLMSSVVLEMLDNILP